jgi:transcriptional regulator of acetoin/glycerol metabolism
MKGIDIIADTLGQVERAVREYVGRPEFARFLEEALKSGGGFEQRVADGIAEQVRAQEKPVRQVWGGVTLKYVAARPRPEPERKEAALAEVRRTGNVMEAADRHGVSRATLYRLMNRR